MPVTQSHLVSGRGLLLAGYTKAPQSMWREDLVGYILFCWVSKRTFGKWEHSRWIVGRREVHTCSWRLTDGKTETRERGTRRRLIFQFGLKIIQLQFSTFGWWILLYKVICGLWLHLHQWTSDQTRSSPNKGIPCPPKWMNFQKKSPNGFWLHDNFFQYF